MKFDSSKFKSVLETEDGRHELDLAGNSAFYADVQIDFVKNDAGFDVYLTAKKTPVLNIELEFAARFENCAFFVDAWERTYGDSGWYSRPGKIMPWYCFVSDGKKMRAFGVRVRPSAMCCWEAGENFMRLNLDVSNGRRGVLLGGRRIRAAQVVFAEYDDADTFASCRDFCKKMCSDGVFPKEKVYGSNNWYYAYGKSSQAEIEEDAEYLAELTANLSPRPYMIIDDCWEKNSCAGPWDELRESFSDMSALSRKIKSMGLKAGIWIRPLFYKGKNFDERWVLRKEKEGGDYLDITVPEAMEFACENVRRLTKWGYTLIKHDFTSYDLFGAYGFKYDKRVASNDTRFSDGSMTNAEIVLKLYRELSKAAGDALVLGCNTFSHLSAGIIPIQRTGDDTSGMEWERTLKMGVNTLAMRSMQNGIFYTCDADCAGITENIDWRKNSQWLKLLSKSGTPLFISSRRGVANNEQKKEIMRAFERNSKQVDDCKPLDWQNSFSPSNWMINGKLEHFEW